MLSAWAWCRPVLSGARAFRCNAIQRTSSQRWLTLDGRQRLSNILTGRTNIDQDDPNENEEGMFLLQKAGLIAPVSSGFYHLLPLGLRVQDRLAKLIDKHMTKIGASKLAMSSACEQSLWQKSGRLQGDLKDMQHELLRLVDRKGSAYLLNPTCEEPVTDLIKSHVHSYRDLPLRLYQITTKYRDEKRPRAGLLRAKEFMMKDLYTFDATEADAIQTYHQIKAAYDAIFTELGIPFLVADADSGNIGGKLNHEYHYVLPAGEDTIWVCDSCDMVANDEVLDKTLSSETGTNERTCPSCSNGKVRSSRTVEIGHTFHLGTKYSQPLGLKFTTEDPNQSRFAQMGCFGIGVSRLLGAMANVLTRPTMQKSPKVGLRWPRNIAPYDVIIIADADVQDTTFYDELVNSTSHGISTTSIEVVMDDRDEKISWKLKRADLTGYPVVIVLGKTFRTQNQVEVFCRGTGETILVSPDEVKQKVVQMLANDPF